MSVERAIWAGARRFGDAGLVSLVEGFWSDSTPFVRRLLLDEAGGRSHGCVEFTFDVFDVALDFDARTAIVIDVLSEGDSEMTTLDEFLARALSFGDDPSVGDGLIQMQRRPPSYRADGRGEVEPIDAQDAAMSAGRAWLGELGYDVEVEVEDGFTWAALRQRTDPNFVIPRYGRGASEDEAIESAARRYRVEQIGTDNARKPGEPLP